MKFKANNGISFEIRSPKISDAKSLMDFENVLSMEKTYIEHQGEITTLREEKDNLQKMLKSIKKNTSVHLLVFASKKLIGMASIECGFGVSQHEGVMGISVIQEFRGMGIGKILLGTTIKEAKKKLKKLRIITLSVFEENKRGYDLYKKMGFKEYGRLPNGVFYKDSYQDMICMYLSV